MREWRSHYPDDQPRAALLMCLHEVHDRDGWISPEAMAEIAQLLGIPPIQVEEVVSFYPLLSDRPRGKAHVRVCRTLSCAVGGCGSLLDHMRERYGLAPGGDTDDGRVSLDTAECIAACGMAPAVLIGMDRHERVTPERLDELINEAVAGA
jgi:NADH-quinone oxidoreductase subunit E